MADIYLGSEVWGFRSGSIVADYNVLFATEDAGQPVVVNMTDATEAFTTALAAEAANLGITIDDSTITVSGKNKNKYIALASLGTFRFARRHNGMLHVTSF